MFAMISPVAMIVAVFGFTTVFFARIIGLLGSAGFFGFSGMGLMGVLGLMFVKSSSKTKAARRAPASPAGPNKPNRSRGIARQIVDTTHQPSRLQFDRDYLHDLYRAFAEDREVNRRLTAGSVAMFCAAPCPADDMLDYLEDAFHPDECRHGLLLKKTGAINYDLNVDGKEYRAQMLGHTSVITIRRSSDPENRKAIIVVLRGNIKVHFVGEPGAGVKPTLLVFALGGKSEVSADGVNLYVIGEGEATIINGNAQAFERFIVTGKKSQIRLHDQSESSFRCDECRIHAYHSSLVRVGSRCGVFLYGEARAVTDGTDNHRVGRAHYDQSLRLVVDEAYEESRPVEVCATRLKQWPRLLAA